MLVDVELEKVITYLENIPKTTRNVPIILTELVFPHVVICSNGVDCCDVLNSKVEHVECRIPPGYNILGHYFRSVEVTEKGKPIWEKESCRVLDCKCDLSQL